MKHLTIAAPCYDRTVTLGYHQSMMQTLVACTQAKIAVSTDYKPGPYIHRNRNWLAHRFLQTESDALMFIDTDVRWPAEAVVRLYDSDLPLCGGCYRLKQDREEYPIKLGTEHDGAWRTALYLPGGFLLIRRHVFEKMRDHVPSYPEEHANGETVHAYFQNVIYAAQGEAGEDVEFCTRWRALGGKVWCLTDIDFSHQGPREWEGNLSRFLPPVYEVADSVA
jgi:hypothetical protein